MCCLSVLPEIKKETSIPILNMNDIFKDITCICCKGQTNLPIVRRLKAPKELSVKYEQKLIDRKSDQFRRDSV